MATTNGLSLLCRERTRRYLFFIYHNLICQQPLIFCVRMAPLKALQDKHNMKITKSQLEQIIKEEVDEILEMRTVAGLSEYGGFPSNIGGVAGQLGAVAGRREPPPPDSADSVVQGEAFAMFMDMGLEEKVAKILVTNIAITDLQTVLEAIPKIDTADEQEALGEVLGPAAKASDYVEDFQDSDAPQFKGKSKKKKTQMAIAAHASAKEKKRGKK